VPGQERRRPACAVSDLQEGWCSVASTVASIGLTLGTHGQPTVRKILVAVHLTSNRDLSEVIFRVSDGRVARNDVDEQLAFIKEDLDSEPTITIRPGAVAAIRASRQESRLPS
jgi:hypothetical protein